MTAPKLRLRHVETRPRLQMIWTRGEDGVLACGPVRIEQGRLTIKWFTYVNGVVACRSYGYHTERDAQRAAPHLGAVRKLIK